MKAISNRHGILKAMAVLASLLVVFSFTGCKTIVMLSNFNEVGENHYTCTLDGVKRDFIVDLPENPKGSPLILMLPGYGDTTESFRLDTGFHTAANEQGFTVVYVSGAPNPTDKTSAQGWNHDGNKKGNDDIRFLKALVDHIGRKYGVNTNLCFAVGFSNGAFMCHRLAVEASDTFTAVVSVAGSMSKGPWENRPKASKVGLFQITGEMDETVPKLSDRSAQYTSAPAIEQVVAYFVNSNNLERIDFQNVGKSSLITKYSSLGEKQVWSLLVADGRHSWSAEGHTGVNTNALILDYIKTFLAN